MARVLHRRVTLIYQPTDYRCWEACARMTYLWKHPGKATVYEKLVAGYVALGRGLTRSEMGYLYCHILGMALHPDPRQVIARSPLIWGTLSGAGGHAMLLIGHDDKHGFINYDPGAALSFKEGASIGGKSDQAGSGKVQLEGNLRFMSYKVFASETAGGVWGYVR